MPNPIISDLHLPTARKDKTSKPKVEAKPFVNPFPPPSQPLDPPEDIEVMGAMITSAENAMGCNGTIWTATIHQDSKTISFRFVTRTYARAARKFFKHLGMKRVPARSGRWVLDPKGGAFVVNLDAVVLGYDDLSKDSTVTQAFVLGKVKMIAMGK